MPIFKPDVWNQPDVVKINNCYNYAVDDLHRPRPGALAPRPAEPGMKHDITAAVVVDAEPSGNGYTLYLDFTCEGIRTAALADGLRSIDEHQVCGPGHWRVAYFVRHFIEGPPAISGTPHFVREDRPGVWSHKPGSLPVTRRQYDPVMRDYGGPLIRDPSKDNVGPRLEFCGYLCCGPHTGVRSLARRQGEQATVVASAGNEIMLASLTVAPGAGGVLDERARWTDGFGSGTLIYRIDSAAGPRSPARTIFVTEQSLTVWDGAPRHTADAGGRTAALLRSWVSGDDPTPG